MPTRIFLSSRYTTSAEIESAWLKRTGCKWRCHSFANLDPEQKNYNTKIVEALDVCEKAGIGIMLDSGAYSIHAAVNKARTGARTGKVTQSPEEMAEGMFQRYVAYCKKNKRKWTFYVTLDFKIHCPTIFAMQKRFAEYGLKPTPVYHGDDSLDYLNKYADMGVKLMCIAQWKGVRNYGNKRKARYYLDNVFNRAAKLGMELHGLAVTSMWLMKAYPWWSVDSSAWSRNAFMGIIQVPNHEKGLIEAIHISSNHSRDSQHSYNKLNRRHQLHIRELCAGMGFDLDKLRESGDERHDFNGKVFSDLSNTPMNTEKQRRVEWENLL